MSPLSNFMDETFPPTSKFKVEDISDLTGRVMIVTGGNAGIGYHTVKALLEHNAKVYLFARSKDKALVAIEKLKEETGKEAIFLQCDLASIASVKKATAEYKSKESELHVLFNSGGVMFPAMDQLTQDGYDLQFGTNVLGHCILTIELLPALIAGAGSSPDKKARVINTSSSGANYTDKIEWDTLTDSPKRTKKGTHQLYFQSKFANAAFSYELSRRYGDQGIVSAALHPGGLKTDLQRNTPKWQTCLVSPLLHPAPMGALTQLWAGTSAAADEIQGKWLIPWARVKSTGPKGADDPEVGKKLWEWVEEQLNISRE